MAARGGWKEAAGTAGGECLVYVALFGLAAVALLAVTVLAAAADDAPLLVAALVAALAGLFAWGLVLTVRHHPGVYLGSLDAPRRRDLGVVRLAAMAWFQLAIVAAFGYALLWLATS